MRRALLWILVLNTLHLPIPCPDLDGECRGAPIHSLAEAHAWHLCLLGVRPNDDIDRGPFRRGDGQERAPTGSPFGDAGLDLKRSPTVARPLFQYSGPSWSLGGTAHVTSGIDAVPRPLGPSPRTRASTAAEHCALACVWRI